MGLRQVSGCKIMLPETLQNLFRQPEIHNFLSFPYRHKSTIDFRNHLIKTKSNMHICLHGESKVNLPSQWKGWGFTKVSGCNLYKTIVRISRNPILRATNSCFFKTKLNDCLPNDNVIFILPPFCKNFSLKNCCGYLHKTSFKSSLPTKKQPENRYRFSGCFK